MDKDNAMLQELNAIFSELDFPEELMEQYEMLECLSNNMGIETFLVSKKENDSYFVVRCYKKEHFENAVEASILKKLNHPQLPAYEGEFENDSMTCVLREYIPGVSLESYMLESQRTREEIIEISLSICEVLNYLHQQTPPVIHRDIKPRNIIIREDGLPVLIDFDIARTYKKDSDVDTVFKGTQVYAPPEQYGFTQTDARSDIYSFGVTLRYMLTGSARENPNIHLYNPLEKIIRKCTAFSPRDRYKEIKEVKLALKRANPKSRMLRGLKIGACAALVCLGMVFAGYRIHDYMTFDPFVDGHIPSVLQDEERMQDACVYLEEKYGTHLLDDITDYATFGLAKQVLEEVYGMEHDYAWIGNPSDPPEESEEHFFPWQIGNEQYLDRLELCYYVTKIYWPEKVKDWSSLKDDNGDYPGSRVAYNWCKKMGILTGVNRPDDNSIGELAIGLANADRVFTALQDTKE